MGRERILLAEWRFEEELLFAVLLVPLLLVNEPAEEEAERPLRVCGFEETFKMMKHI